MKTITASRLKKGDVIGIVSPCYAITEDSVAKTRATLEEMGFRVKTGRHIYSTAYGYAASLEERVADFNDMIADQDVRMILFALCGLCVARTFAKASLQLQRRDDAL